MMEGRTKSRLLRFRPQRHLLAPDASAQPNLFLIGVPKAGTTTLHEVLRAHPRIFMTKVKETGYFASARQYSRGLDYYQKSFFSASSEFPIRGESTPWYLYPPATPARIRETLAPSSPRFIVLLRDPVARAYSMYLDRVQGLAEKLSFEQAIAKDLALPAPRDSGEQSDYVDRYVLCGMYANPLERYFDIFGRESVLVLFSEDLRESSSHVMGKVARFLDLDDYWSSQPQSPA